MAGTIEKEKVAEPSRLSGDLREETRRLRAELERYRSVFDSARMIVGHEFLRPLTSISGYVELLEDRLADAAGDEESRYFAKIRSSVAQIEELVETFLHMLAFERVHRWAGELERIDIRGCVERLRPKYGGGRARIRNAVSPDLPKVLTRRKHIEIVLDNLISNALKHSGETSPVKVTAEVRRDRRSSAADRVVIVKVSDEGPGIPPGDMEKIFDPFYKGGDEKGLGLGLSLVQSVLRLMGGGISVGSDPGRGTEVTFTLPLDGASDVDPLAAES